MSMDTLSTTPVAVWRGFLRLVKAAIVRAALAGLLHPCRAEWLLRRLHMVEV